MASPLHHVIIGSGSAGFGAAMTLRAADANCRITMITMDRLPFYNRFDLPRVFRGQHDWRELLDVRPAHYEEVGIRLRRASRVVDVDGTKQLITLAHQETVSYDRLLVCAGGRSYVPENLTDYADLMYGFGSFEAAMRTYRDLPKGGRVIMIGGDMIGIDLALTLLDTGYDVALIVNQQTFWPHEMAPEERSRLLKALQAKGLMVFEDNRPVRISRDSARKAASCVTLEDGTEVAGDVVMSFCGLSSSVEFMLGADVDIERGLLVNPELRTSNDTIWAAGDVCQIWHDEEKAYKFYHGWKNVRVMGELAARNMAGAHEIFDVDIKEQIGLDTDGQLSSTFWTQ
ncbi:MAG: NAD(P)/FAD-dependent oxidoreductase [Paracoccaceae bacterium]